MPGPVLAPRGPLLRWTDPAQASVFDGPLVRAARAAIQLLGLNDPSQAVAIGAPMEIPTQELGGAMKFISEKLPQLKQAIIKAYHGSPYDFDAFDASKIGTGEGAQAYGHGLYFAENPEVARQYRDELGSWGLVRGRKPFEAPPNTNGAQWLKMSDQQQADWVANDSIARAWQSKGYGPYRTENIIESAKDGVKVTFRSDPAWRDRVLAEIDSIGRDLKVAETGKMYEVAIKADPEQFLDWDKPLSQQSEAVRKAITADPVMQRRIASASDEHTGSTLIRSLAGEHPEQRLKASGIPGIKYLDQGSRAMGEGSRNYVVFDAATVEILRKYGLLLPAVPAAGMIQPGQEP